MTNQGPEAMDQLIERSPDVLLGQRRDQEDADLVRLLQRGPESVREDAFTDPAAARDRRAAAIGKVLDDAPSKVRDSLRYALHDLHGALRRQFYRSRALQTAYRHRHAKAVYRRFVLPLLHRPAVDRVELTSVCNAACTFCPYPLLKGAGKPQVFMPAEVFEQVMGEVTARGRSRVSFTPTTGELLLHKGWDTCLSRALMLHHVEEVTFYTNAIPLDARNRARLLALPEGHKLTLNLSVGGPDAAAYRQLFQVDKFDRVVANVRGLLADLANARRCTPVGIEVRVPSGEPVSVAAAERLYNPGGYPHAGVNIRDVYDPMHGLLDGGAFAVPGQAPRYQPRASRTRRPCKLLGDTRFAADGTVWACGCAVSELPDDTSLWLGTLDEDPVVRERRRVAITDAWRVANSQPRPCSDCTVYVPSRRAGAGDAALRRRPARKKLLPAWKRSY